MKRIWTGVGALRDKNLITSPLHQGSRPFGHFVGISFELRRKTAFTSGYVPWWNEFPGAHIPAPLQIGSAGPTDIEARSREILTLSKMNWNSSDGITRLPVTLLFAKKVGEIMTELSDNVTPNPSFRFHM
jgi:hypothetical protein